MNDSSEAPRLGAFFFVRSSRAADENPDRKSQKRFCLSDLAVIFTRDHSPDKGEDNAAVLRGVIG
jgi:hypothetical protein